MQAIHAGNKAVVAAAAQRGTKKYIIILYVGINPKESNADWSL